MMNENKKDKPTVLLALLPYWTPQIPPLGISCLKSYLNKNDFNVVVDDVNIEGESREFYNAYFDILREHVSANKRGNFYNIGHEVLQNHMMAHIHKKDHDNYFDLIRILVKEIFFCGIDDDIIVKLNHILDDYYQWLEKHLRKLHERIKPDVFGLSVYKGNLPSAMFAFNLFKQIDNNIRTVMGGAVFAQTLGPGTEGFEKFLEITKGYIDNLIIGEGEILFLKLLEGELDSSKRVYSISDIDNRLFPLTEIVEPDFSDLNYEYYPSLAMYSSRSCPYQCKFCTETVYWGKYRKVKVDQLVHSFKNLRNKYNNQLYLLCDSLINPVVTELAELLAKEKLGVYWDGYLRVDKKTIEQKNAYIWRKGGLYRVRIGVESGSRKVLDSMNKQISIQDIKQTLINISNAGIKITTYWIIGYPGEEEEDFQKTLDLIEEMQDYIYEAECNAFGFYPSGQVNSDEWLSNFRPQKLFPSKFEDMLICNTWYLDGDPNREVTYDRINRFVNHCKKLNIANPYSLYDINQADERWGKLHKNAVPPLILFKNKEKEIDEWKDIVELKYLDKNSIDIEFGF